MPLVLTSGKKCTYGIKCKFSHPGRAKQYHRSLADELREKARMASSPHRAPWAGHDASLEEVMEQKLTLDLKGPLKKVHTSENVPVLKSGPQSTQRKFPLKRERPGHNSPTSLDSVHTPSQELLDSGLGSYECQGTELQGSHSDHPHRGQYKTSGSRYRPPPSCSQPCSCCSLQSVSCSTGYQHHSMDLAASPNPGVMPYYEPQYNSYGGASSYQSLNRPQYSLPHDFHGRMHPPPQHGYWSEPYGGYSHSPPSPRQGEIASWAPAPPKASPPMPEREQMRKKLRAVFNARLVDRAMNMFPNLMDPQKLAVEILNLQSYEGVL